MTQSLTPVDRLVVALDVPTRQQALALARQLQGRVGMLKVGLELFCAEGAGFIQELQAFAPVFLDLKLHDIPNTVLAGSRSFPRYWSSSQSLTACKPR